MNLDLAYALQPVVTQLASNSSLHPPEDKAALGVAARRLLDFALLHTPDPALLRGAVSNVVKTISSDVQASLHVLRKCLTSEQMRDRGDTLVSLARHVPELVALPEFVADLYTSAFLYHEARTDVTTVGSSQIFSMTSNRRQDHALVLHILADHFAAFIGAGPAAATRALVAIMNDYVDSNHYPLPAHSILLSNCRTMLRPDHSFFWDIESSHNHDTELKLLTVWEQLLMRCHDHEFVTSVRHVLTESEAPAILYSRILRAATENQDVFQGFRSLLWDQTILTADDTSTAAGRVLTSSADLLSLEELSRVETVIMAVPVGGHEEERAQLHIRDRLLGCIPSHRLVTSTARAQRTLLEEAGGAPENRPRVTMHSWGGEPPTAEENLAEQGVAIQDAAVQNLLALAKPIRAFRAQHWKTVPTVGEVHETLSALQPFMNSLEMAQPIQDALDNDLTDIAARACDIILRHTPTAWVDHEPLIRRAITRALASKYPESDDGEFARLSWSCPNARIVGAAAMIRLGAFESFWSPETPVVLQQLTSDSVAAVRYQIVAGLHGIYRHAQTLFWTILDSLVRHEPTAGVLQGVLQSLNSVVNVEPGKVSAATSVLLARLPRTKELDDVLDKTVQILVGLTIVHQHAPSTALIESFIASPATHAEVVQRLILDAITYMERGDCQIAHGVLFRALMATITEIRRLESLHQSSTDIWSPSDQAAYKTMYHALDSAALHLSQYLRSSTAAGMAATQEHFKLVDPFLQILCVVGHPSVAHHLVEAYSVVVIAEPRAALLGIAETVRVGVAAGYHMESMAHNVVVGLMERYLTEFRPLLREDRECQRAVLTILDSFVEAGWPRAQQLVFRLDEIYR